MTTPTTPLFVPHAFEDGPPEGVVERCHVAEGDAVSAGELLVEVRAGPVRAQIESPIAGRLARLYLGEQGRVRAGEILAEIAQDGLRRKDESTERSRSASSAALSDRSPELPVVATAATAFVWPTAAVVTSAVVAAFIAMLARAHTPSGARGPADSVVLPMRMAVAGAQLLRARATDGGTLLAALARLLVCLAIGVLIPAAIGALLWLLTQGTDGTVAAVRLAAFGHALPVFAFLVSVLLLRSAVLTPAPRRAVRSAAANLPETGLTALTLATAAWVVVALLFVTPRTWWPAESFADLVQRLPTGLSKEVDVLRASLVRAEAAAVVDCLDANGRRGWRAPRAFVRAGGGLIVGVRRSPDRPPGPRSVAVMLLAMHNQLAPHGVEVNLVPRGASSIISITPPPVRRPAADIERVRALAAFTSGAARLLPSPTVASPRDVKVALQCSAAAL